MMQSATQPQQPREPYCGSCGYVLTGLTDSARCPECGKPLIDVLVRPGFAAPQGKRYRSKAMLFGWPVIDVAFGPAKGELKGRARGIIAIGDEATGGVAIGGFARGIVAVGGAAVGVFAMGGGAIGMGTAIGGGAVGGIAIGGGAAGGIAIGGGALGWIARGGGAVGIHTIGPRGASSQQAQDIFDSLAWFLGSSAPTASSLILPVVWVLMLTLAIAAAIGVIALGALRGHDDKPQTTDVP